MAAVPRIMDGQFTQTIYSYVSESNLAYIYPRMRIEEIC